MPMNGNMDQTEDWPMLTYEVSDETLEGAAMGVWKAENLTLTFCSTPWTCPISRPSVSQ